MLDIRRLREQRLHRWCTSSGITTAFTTTVALLEKAAGLHRLLEAQCTHYIHHAGSLPVSEMQDPLPRCMRTPRLKAERYMFYPHKIHFRRLIAKTGHLTPKTTTQVHMLFINRMPTSPRWTSESIFKWTTTFSFSEIRVHFRTDADFQFNWKSALYFTRTPTSTSWKSARDLNRAPNFTCSES